MAKQSREEFYKQLKVSLKDSSQFPLLYMFKFIVPTDQKKVAQVYQLFPLGAEISQRPSKKGNYQSLTIKIVMTSADEIIKIYQSAEAIEGIVAL